MQMRMLKTIQKKPKVVWTYHKAVGRTRRSHYSARISCAQSLQVCGTFGDVETLHVAHGLWWEKSTRRGKTADSAGAFPWSQSSKSGQTGPTPRTGNGCATSPNHWQESPSDDWPVEEYWALEQHHCIGRKINIRIMKSRKRFWCPM